MTDRASKNLLLVGVCLLLLTVLPGAPALAATASAPASPLAAQGSHGSQDAGQLRQVEDPPGSITVNKSEAGGADPGQWAFQVQGPAGSYPPLASGQTLSDLPLGQYAITELGPAGWHLESVAGDGCAQVGQSASANLVSAGQAITCTLANVLGAPSVTIEKHVSDNGSTWHDADDPPGPDIIEFDPVFWSFEVSNTGNVALIDLVVADSEMGEICTIDSLAVGENQTCTSSSPAVAGQHENLGTVSGWSGDTPVAAEDYCHYFGIGYLIPTVTPEPPTPTPSPAHSDTPVPVAPAATPTPTVVLEVLGAERLPAAGLPPTSRLPGGTWLTAIALLLVASGGILRKFARRD